MLSAGMASASVASLSSRYSDLPTHKRFSVGRVITAPGCASTDVSTGRGVFSLWFSFAIPAGVTALRSPRLVCAFLIVIFIILLSQQLFFCSKQRVLTIKVQFAPTLAEEKHEDSCGRKARPLKNYRL